MFDAINDYYRAITPAGQPAPQLKFGSVEAESFGDFGEPITVSATIPVAADPAPGLGLIPQAPLASAHSRSAALWSMRWRA